MFQEYYAVGSFFFLIVLVIIRILLLKKQGIEAAEFGKKDKKDLIIPPFVFFYLYLLTANAFEFPTIPYQMMFHSEVLAWVGDVTCSIVIIVFIWALISFKTSFRIGLVENTDQGLITTGAFAISRNPIYFAFVIMFISQFLVFSSWIVLIYIFLGFFTIRAQVIKEEAFLREQYGDEFASYCTHVNRWIGKKGNA